MAYCSMLGLSNPPCEPQRILGGAIFGMCHHTEQLLDLLRSGSFENFLATYRTHCRHFRGSLCFSEFEGIAIDILSMV